MALVAALAPVPIATALLPACAALPIAIALVPPAREPSPIDTDEAPPARLALVPRSTALRPEAYNVLSAAASGAPVPASVGTFETSARPPLPLGTRHIQTVASVTAAPLSRVEQISPVDVV